MKKLSVVVLLFISACCIAQKKVTVQPLGNNFSITLPDFCNLLSPAELTAMYPRANGRPATMYGTPDRSFLVGFTPTDRVAKAEKMIAHKEEMIAELKSLPTVTWISDEVKTINGHRYIVCTFNKPVRITGQTSYNKILFTVLNGKILMCMIAISGDISQERKDMVDEIVASLIIQ